MSKAPSKGQVRVRFAPSPTGFLHVGGARTALFNWLYARANGGVFLLRIEDTDRERSEDRFTEDILESLRWLGLQWDEEPVFQSKQFDTYRCVAEELVAAGKAYWCDCSSETLDRVRAQCEAEKRPFRYPGTCREAKKPRAGAVLRVKNPKEGETTFHDLIRGTITFRHTDLDDWVALRADGSPTYNFTVVVDDHTQRITHVLRGDDHINNTPKQILLYQALGYPVPFFAHLPMILGTDKAKLSKRHGAASTLEYRKQGYLPETMLNFLVRLGWSHGDQELFTVEEMCRFFSLERIGKSGAVFNPEKLNWMAGQHMRNAKAAFLFDYTRKYFPDESAYWEREPRAQVEAGITIIQGKVKTIVELLDQMTCLFGEDPSYDVGALPETERAMLRNILERFGPVFDASGPTKEKLEPATRALAESMGLKLASVAKAVRFAVTGGRVSPGLFEMLEVQGSDRVRRRLEAARRALS
jgi:glutamyl-tRNA synthetase